MIWACSNSYCDSLSVRIKTPPVWSKVDVIAKGFGGAPTCSSCKQPLVEVSDDPVNVETDQIIEFWYTNHRNVFAKRRCVPVQLYFGSVPEYYPTLRWLLKCIDLDKKAYRTFDIQKCVFVDANENGSSSFFLGMMKANAKAQEAWRRLLTEVWSYYQDRGNENVLKALGLDHDVKPIPPKQRLEQYKAIRDKVQGVLSRPEGIGILHVYVEYFGQHDPYFDHHDIITQDANGKWWFEGLPSESEKNGPFDTEQEVQIALKQYCDSI